MKVVQREIMKILPGKMAETMQLLGKHMAIATRLAPPNTIVRSYRPFFTEEAVHTLALEVEWESMAAMEEFFKKAMADPELQALMPKWDEVEESHKNELYMLTPLP
jgi:hypothetical protein